MFVTIYFSENIKHGLQSYKPKWLGWHGTAYRKQTIHGLGIRYDAGQF